jgi:hypothetical protein
MECDAIGSDSMAVAARQGGYYLRNNPLNGKLKSFDSKNDRPIAMNSVCSGKLSNWAIASGGKKNENDITLELSSAGLIFDLDEGSELTLQMRTRQ